MPLFEQEGQQLQRIQQSNFSRESELQTLVERNLREIFNCRFVASEFSTGSLHGGRIDTLALSEDGNPVILEYKKVESSELVNQSLFYLHWILDHKGDFEIAVQKALGSDATVDWSDVRVICLAPDFKKYDIHAVQVMGANLELWRYRRFAGGAFYLEEVLTDGSSRRPEDGKDPVMVAAGKKAAETRRTATYTFDEHLDGKPEKIRDLVEELRNGILDVSSSIEEAPKKFYVAYRTTQNIACVEVQTQKAYVFLKLEPEDVPDDVSDLYRDMRNIGHYGTGDASFTLEDPSDVERVLPLVERSFQKVGG